MTKRARRNHTPTFKAKVALAAIKGEKTLSEQAQPFDVHPNRITQWRGPRLEGAAEVFGRDKTEAAAPAVDLKALHAKIGELALENDFLSGALGKAGLLSAKRRSTASTTCRFPARRRLWASAAARSPISRVRFLPATCRSCGGSTNGIWSARSRGRAGCAIFSPAKASRSAGGMSQR